ncbi:hypothetical protein BD410DRAFT_560111 [Rickenella mellea]|uniref:Uncharacterized protein n=1 Tax=Rickenella mellea TaxID=50990 RepID=A0A4Y7QE74_9AGAM|nr:hypothetical protein BD410DRAFT_560111 [Rickenella mellea]
MSSRYNHRSRARSIASPHRSLDIVNHHCEFSEAVSSRNRAPRSRSTDSAVRAPFNEGTSDVTNEAIPFNEGSIANAPQQYPMQEDVGSQRALADIDIKQSSADAPLQYPMQEDEGSQRALADTDIMQSSVSAPASEQSSVNLNLLWSRQIKSRTS